MHTNNVNGLLAAFSNMLFNNTFKVFAERFKNKTLLLNETKEL
jgi:hypothetical protein